MPISRNLVIQSFFPCPSLGYKPHKLIEYTVVESRGISASTIWKYWKKFRSLEKNKKGIRTHLNSKS